MNRKYLVVAALTVVILLSATVLGVFAARQYAENREGPPEGKVKLESVYLAPKVPGRLLSVRVEEGDIVRPGDTLAVIDAPEIAARLDQARGAVASARAQYEMAGNGATEFDRRRVRAQLDAARAQYDYALASYTRMQHMFSDSLIAAQEYDKIRSRYRAAVSQLEAAKAQAEDVESGVRPEKVAMARGDYQRALATLAEAETAWSDRVITAPKSMRIQTVVLRPGELATPGYNLFAGYGLETPSIRFTIPESQLHAYETGQVWHLRTGFGDTVFRATLDRIVPLPSYAAVTSMYPRHRLGESVYELRFRPLPDEPAGHLQHNMTILLDDNPHP